MHEKRFDPAKLDRLNNPERLQLIPPAHIWNQLGLNQPRVLVDIGAGTGFFAVPFLQFVPGGTLYACDVSEVMLDWIKDQVCPRYPGIIPILAEGTCIPLESGIADLVYTINLHHELDAPLDMLREAHRLLRPGGRMFITDWKQEETIGGPPLSERLNPSEVEAQLMEAGFSQVRTDLSLARNFLLLAEKPSK